MRFFGSEDVAQEVDTQEVDFLRRRLGSARRERFVKDSWRTSSPRWQSGRVTVRRLRQQAGNPTGNKGRVRVQEMSELSKKLLVSLVVPVFNEEANVEAAYRAIDETFAGVADRYDFEIIFTDNHSTDRTFEIISRLAKQDSRIRSVRFTRNFGFHRSVLTGYRLSRGDAAVQIDCDLQDPPAVVLEFLEAWEKGHDLVFGVRRERNDGQSYQWARRNFYRLLKRVSNDNIQIDSGDFRLLDRSLLDQIAQIHDASPYVRGLTSAISSNQIGVRYDRRPRMAGQSKFPLRRLISLAIDALLAHSIFPLRLATYTGLIISVTMFLFGIFYITAKVALGIDMPAGFATTTTLLLFGISLNAIFLGIIGEYIGRIYDQVRVRPLTVVERSVNMGVASLTGRTRPNLSGEIDERV